MVKLNEATRSASYLKRGSSSNIMLAIICLGVFSVFYPTGSINVNLPIIAADLGVSPSVSVFITITYTVLSGVLTLPFGRLGDRIGYQKVFVLGEVLVVIGYLATGFFGNTLILIILFRCILAVGSAMVQSVTQAMLMMAFRGERGKMMGLHSTFVSLTGVVSPVIGGIISDTLGWRASIMFGVPFAAAAFVLGLVYLGEFDCKKTGSDLKGTALMVVLLTSLMLSLNGRTVTGTPMWFVIAMFAVFLVSLVTFVRVENRCEHPLLAIKYLKRRKFALGNVALLLGYTISTGVSSSIPFYLQNIKGTSTTVSSLFLTLFPLLMAILAPYFGARSDKTSPQRYLLIGAIITTVSTLLYTTLSAGTSLWFFAAVRILYGVGSGMIYAPASTIVMGSVPATDGGVASGMISTMRNVAGAIGATIYSMGIQLSTNHYAGTTDADTIYVLSQRNVTLVFAVINFAFILTAFVLYKNRNEKPYEVTA